jgi:para-nitrobenzyl esterase
MKKITQVTTCFLLIMALLAGFFLTACNQVPKQNRAQDQKPIVKTIYGSISGSVEEGVFSFKGIPYAKAERFMPPQKPDAWEGVREYTKFGPIAMQVNSWSSEDAMDEHKLFTVYGRKESTMEKKGR